MHRKIKDHLSKQKKNSLYRKRCTLQSPQGPMIECNGKSFLSFCSNDYLGLANHPDIIKAFKQGAERYGVGSGASQLITGHSFPHAALEEALADFLGYLRVLVFSTGYMANIGVITSLISRHDTVFLDRLSHASLIDASLMAQGKLLRYKHLDLTDLSKKISQSNIGEKLIVTEGVFSMEGDTPPLPALHELAKTHQAWLMVDDAHGVGVLGKHGRGSIEHHNVLPDILVGTFGKAFGTFGAFVAGSDDFIEYLIQSSRSYIYTTAQPPAVAQATLASLKIVRNESWRREKLTSLIEYFKKGVKALGLNVAPSNTPIQPLIIGDAEKTLNLSKKLEQQGIMIPAIRPPTVPDGQARLRLTLSALHTEEHIDYLLEYLAALSSSSAKAEDPGNAVWIPRFRGG